MTHFQPGDRVLYVPHHAHGDLGHEDVERGTVSSVVEVPIPDMAYTRAHGVFVKFDASVQLLGWDGCTPKCCTPGSLRKIAAEYGETLYGGDDYGRP